MPRYRSDLPQLNDTLFLTDGGMETTLIYHQHQELPFFAAFTLLETLKGRQELIRYYERYLALAVRYRTGLILESPTWRANEDWGRALGHSPTSLADLNRAAMNFIAGLRSRDELAGLEVVLSGNIGPRGDGYVPNQQMKVSEAADYHAEQIMTFATTEADLVSAFTINYTEEAIGIAHAARILGMPVVISFTVETDGRLPSGDTLQCAIERIDERTNGHPAYYMINCAHPSHFIGQLDPGAAWLERVRGIRANASKLDHAALNAMTTLDEGDPAELAQRYLELRGLMPSLNIVGGCCGTDHRHVGAMVSAVTGIERAA